MFTKCADTLNNNIDTLSYKLSGLFVSKTYEYVQSSLTAYNGEAIPISNFNVTVPTGYAWLGCRRFYSTNMHCAVIGVRNTYIYIHNVTNAKITDLHIYIDVNFIREEFWKQISTS